MKRAYGYKFVCLRVQLVILRKLGVVELVAAAVLPRRRHWWWVNVHRRYQIHYRRWSITATHPFINPSAFLHLLTLPARIHTQTHTSLYMCIYIIHTLLHTPTHKRTIKTISLPILCSPLWYVYTFYRSTHVVVTVDNIIYTTDKGPIATTPHHHVHTWLDAAAHFQENVLFEYRFSIKSWTIFQLERTYYFHSNK